MKILDGGQRHLENRYIGISVIYHQILMKFCTL